ncbi:MAG: HtpX2, heat shock protein HtpX, heat shock protein HtpX [Candidatus Paceibacter sp.]|nr:HtpX2, heat shock protein HtpX, heat shock protein HtpX [Candidatus Paceibacter sp.]
MVAEAEAGNKNFMNIYHEQSKNVTKTWILMTVFLVVVIGIGWVFSLVYNNPGILYIAVIFSILMNIFSYWFSDKIVLKMYRAQEVTDASHVDLYNTVENLSITAGLPMPKVYVIPDPAPNAFATGRNKNHAAVAVTSGLLERLNKTELEGVIAHELAHIGNRDILISTIVVVLVGFISILSDMFMRSMIFGGNRDNDRGGNILAIVGIVLAILSPIVATIIQLAISRKREYLADASGALLTRYPEGLASALEKISSYPVQMKRATNATAHMFISNPFGGAGRKMAALFATHPPAEDRIRILRGMK